MPKYQKPTATAIDMAAAKAYTSHMVRTRHSETAAPAIIADSRAVGGDTACIRFCLDRIAPVRKDRPVHFELPKMTEAKDAVKASAAIVGAVASGDLTPSEAAELCKVVDSCARTLQVVEFEDRLSKLEKAIAR